MAEKGFGVKEINLIGASGTPTIESPNNLNLNAVNVAISTNVSIGGTLTVSGNLSIGGTITYEDVTNVDAIGIVTAREGVFIPDNKELKIGQSAASPDLKIYSDGTNGYVREQGPGSLYIQGINVVLENTSGTNYFAGVSGAESIIYHNGNAKITTSSSGATVTGTLTATTFSGSGASLTNLPAANLTGTLPAISGANLTNLPADTPTNSDIQVVYTVTANGSSAYRFGGNGIVSTADNPDVYLIRGLKYRFINNSGGSHPFQIRESSGGSAYSAGVTNNGAASGNIDFQVPYSAPSRLYYQCTSHGGMVGNLYIRGAGGQNTNVGVTTFSGNVVVDNGTIRCNNGFSSDVDLYLNADANNNGAGSIIFQESGSETFRISSNGTVIVKNNGINLENASATSSRAYSITNAAGTTGWTFGNGVTASSHQFVIYDNTAGAARLTIASNGQATFAGNKVRINGGATGRSIDVETTHGSGGEIASFQNNVNNAYGGLVVSGGENDRECRMEAAWGSGYMTFYTNNGQRMQISANGNIGAPSGNNIYNASDERLKENMVELTNGLDKIKKLKPISFNWKDGWDVNLDGKKEYGFGAQTTKAVDEILVEPFSSDSTELNGETIENLLRVNENYIIPLLVKAIQELSTKNDELEAKVAVLEGS